MPLSTLPALQWEHVINTRSKKLFVCLIWAKRRIQQFQSYREGVWMRQRAQCPHLVCCLTEISRPRHFDMIGHPVTLY